MGKRKQPPPIDEPKNVKMRLLPQEEIEFHRQFVEDEPLDPDQRHLRFMPPADAEQIRSVTREIDVEKLKQRSRGILERYAAKGYAEVPDVVLVMPPTAPTTPQPGRESLEARVSRYRRYIENKLRLLSPAEIQSYRQFMEGGEPFDAERNLQAADAELVPSVARGVDFKKVNQKIGELLDKYVAKGSVEVPADAPTTQPGRVSEERIAHLRRFRENGFRPIPERVLRSSYFSEAQAEVMRNFNRVFLKAEAELKPHVAKALEEYDAKGYLECDAEGKIKVTHPRHGSTSA